MYCLSFMVVLLQLVGMTGAQKAQAVAPAYLDVSYPIINKLPAPGTNRVIAAGSFSTVSMWPIHGIITTRFGEYHEPWQATHTGIDISSAKPVGVTPVAAFREGIVTQVIHSSVSYGNHVVIDHGGGLTSLYGHLADTTATVGQHVHAGDIIGHEGSTGASTGPHVHFETDLNGKPVSPRNYVNGSP